MVSLVKKSNLINIIVLGFSISMFTDLLVKRLNRLTSNLKDRVLRSQVSSVIHKNRRRNFIIFFFLLFLFQVLIRKLELNFFYKFKFNLFKTHKQLNIIYNTICKIYPQFLITTNQIYRYNMKFWNIYCLL